jgi:hypothetical protein
LLTLLLILTVLNQNIFDEIEKNQKICRVLYLILCFVEVERYKFGTSPPAPSCRRTIQAMKLTDGNYLHLQVPGSAVELSFAVVTVIESGVYPVLDGQGFVPPIFHPQNALGCVAWFRPQKVPCQLYSEPHLIQLGRPSSARTFCPTTYIQNLILLRHRPRHSHSRAKNKLVPCSRRAHNRETILDQRSRPNLWTRAITCFIVRFQPTCARSKLGTFTHTHNSTNAMSNPQSNGNRRTNNQQTSRSKPVPAGNEEASTVLNLGEFQDVDTLTLSEASLVINALVNKRRIEGKDVEKNEYVVTWSALHLSK